MFYYTLEVINLKILVDTHTHTNCSDHAFGTICENIHYGKQRGLEMVCMTNHTPAIPDAAHKWHFVTMKELPDYIEGVRVLCGCEVNILNNNGDLDMSNEELAGMAVVVASIHGPCYDSRKLMDHTETWLNVINNPQVNIMGHSGNPLYLYDLDKVISAAKKNNKCVEINNHSYSVREGSAENCKAIAKKCMELGCNIVVGSDAHTPFDVGNFDLVIEMLNEINFPEELIMNLTPEKFTNYLKLVGRNIK